MAGNLRLFLRMLSPRSVARAAPMLDKHMVPIIILCWLAALGMVALASFAVQSAAVSKKQSAAMRAGALVPVMSATMIEPAEARLVIERLRPQFPDVAFSVDADQALTVSANQGGAFRQWIAALGAIDTVAPHERWTIRDFCVGACDAGLMKAVVTGQKISFSQAPE